MRPSPKMTETTDFIAFLREVLKRKKLLPSKMAVEMGISHATVSRWLSGHDVPDIESCYRLAEYCGVSIEEILIVSGRIPHSNGQKYVALPEFREYVSLKFPGVLDDDTVTMIEDLIERKRTRKAFMEA